MLINNRQFSGERPKKSVRNIGPNEAQVALDCDIVSDELRPMMTNRFIEPSPIEDPGTIFLVNDVWVAFDNFVNAITTNIDSDEKRVFWTEEGSFPRQATIEQFQFGTFFRMGVPKPVAPEAPSISGSGTGTAITSFYVVSFVNAFGEEGDKSDPSPTFDFTLGQEINVGGLGSVVANSGNIDPYNIVSYRLYRFSEGSSRFVTEQPVSVNSFNDNTSTVVLGESFSREDYAPPPIDMQGLHLMANGIAAGFSGRTVHLSEAFLPNAWPYSFEVNSNIVALSSYDNNLVVLTEGYPEVAAILDPINVSSAQLSDREPCVSARSVVQGAGGVIYAAPSGIYYIGARGGRMLTEEYFDDKDWSQYLPSSINAVYRDGEYIAFHDSTEKEGRALVFDTREPNAVVTQISDWTRAPYVREGTDDLYFVQEGNINLYQGGGERRVYTWKSKQHGAGSPYNLDCYRILSCDFINNLSDTQREAFETLVQEIINENMERFAAWSTLPKIWGFGGGINTHVFAGCGLQDIPNGPTNQGVGSVFGSGQVDSARRLPIDNQNFAVQLTVWRDKVILDVIAVAEDEPGRIEYSDRARLWEYELKGNVEITQASLAGSMGELHNGS